MCTSEGTNCSRFSKKIFNNNTTEQLKRSTFPTQPESYTSKTNKSYTRSIEDSGFFTKKYKTRNMKNIVCS